MTRELVRSHVLARELVLFSPVLVRELAQELALSQGLVLTLVG
jgi:hypothetical protein